MMRRDQGIKASRDRVVARSRASLASWHLRGFTLIELLLAVLVLLAVIIATARIFGTASDVTGIGQATANVLQEAAVIERYMREDIERLSEEGVFLIRQVAVQNNVHAVNPDNPSIDELLDPNLHPEAYIRADQLLFFTDGLGFMQTLGIGEGARDRVQSTASRVYYGHAFQLPDGQPFIRPQGSGSGWGHDPAVDLAPWYRRPPDGENVSMVSTRIAASSDAGGTTGTGVFEPQGVVDTHQDQIDGSQPAPARWLMSRQPVVLVNDSRHATHTNSRTVLFAAGATGTRSRTARSIFKNSVVMHSELWHPIFGWTREIVNGRFDGAASMPHEIRRYITNFTTGNPNDTAWWQDEFRPWHDPSVYDQRGVLSQELLYYPRAERRGPSMQRQDQALTNHIIGSAVSSIIIEWTWDDGVGEMRDENDNIIANPAGVLPAQPDHWVNSYAGFMSNCYYAGDPCYPIGAAVQQQDRPEQPWFGINLDRNSWKFDPEPFGGEGGGRGVGFMALPDPFQHNMFEGAYQNVANYHYPLAAAWWPPQDNTDAAAFLNPIERYGTANDFDYPPWNQVAHPDRIHIYEAFFGYNRSESLVEDPPGVFWPTFNHTGFPDIGYTPWPTAIRVTLIMHDPQGRLERGREFQFTIALPDRARKQSRP